MRGRRASAAVPGRPWASSCFTLSSSSLWMEQHAQPFCSCTVSAPAMVPAVLISCGRARGQGPPRGLAYPVIWAQSNRRVRCLWIPAYVCARLFPVWVENATVLNASEKFCVQCIIFSRMGGSVPSVHGWNVTYYCPPLLYRPKKNRTKTGRRRVRFGRGRTSASMFTAATSFTMTPTRRPSRFSSRCFSVVVLPAGGPFHHGAGP